MIKHIRDEGLILESRRPGVLTIVDPTVDAEIVDALTALNRARSERDAYERETRAERETERKKVEAKAIKQALQADDPDAIRAALAGTVARG